jgi:hypothetical protein
MSRRAEHHRFWWNGVLVDVRYEPEWLSAKCLDDELGHLEVVSVYPEYAAIPITETGYRSHFTLNEEVLAAGGPVAYVEAWLTAESQSKAWRDREQAARQFDLF